MCILLTTSAHKDFPFILASNRDEYFKRPTATARFHSTNNSILSPYDLAKPTHGTWIGVSKTGRIGVLVNYRDDDGREDSDSYKEFSRGTIVNDFLNSNLSADEWEAEFFAKYDREKMRKIGGFSLLLGVLDFVDTTSSSENGTSGTHTVPDGSESRRSKNAKIKPLKIISNRGASSDIFVPIKKTSNDTCTSLGASSKSTSTASPGSIQPAATDVKILADCPTNSSKTNVTYRETRSYYGLSNSLFLEPWPKVLIGENLLNNLVINSINESWNEAKLVKELFKLLSFNCLKPTSSSSTATATATGAGTTDDDLLEMVSVYDDMKSSIFIPPLKTPYYHNDAYKSNSYVGDYYGTRTQTLILLHEDGTLKYIERTLHANDLVQGSEQAPFDTCYSFNIFKEREIATVKKATGELNVLLASSIPFPSESAPVSASPSLVSVRAGVRTSSNNELPALKKKKSNTHRQRAHHNDVPEEDESNYADDETSIYGTDNASISTTGAIGESLHVS